MKTAWYISPFSQVYWVLYKYIVLKNGGTIQRSITNMWVTEYTTYCLAISGVWSVPIWSDLLVVEPEVGLGKEGQGDGLQNRMS